MTPKPSTTIVHGHERDRRLPALLFGAEHRRCHPAADLQITVPAETRIGIETKVRIVPSPGSPSVLKLKVVQ